MTIIRVNALKHTHHSTEKSTVRRKLGLSTKSIYIHRVIYIFA